MSIAANMYQMLFKNRWAAGLFVAVTAYSAVAFVSDGGGDDTLAQAAAELRGRPVDDGALDHGKTQADQNRSSSRQAKLAFTPDNELIDDASGFDPSPIDESTPDWDDDSEGRDTGPDMDDYDDDDDDGDAEEHF